MSTALPTAYFTGTSSDIVDLTALGFKSIGHVSKENAPTFTPETEQSDVDAWGLLEPARTDMISRKTTVKWTGLETHKANLELYHNRDLSTVTYDSTTGETKFADPTEPDIIYHRVLFLAVDGAGANRIIIIKECPKFAITEVGEQQMHQDTPIQYDITGRAYIDDTAGYAVQNIFGGPGWKAIAGDAGFTATP
ncbi:hypothetical protein AB0E01_23100 [Nocardia vinacea]|uniref:phage tail tube protein n=1 Tax=Nocardia vinacea TaxID=96468 RepID=UPI00340E5D7A